MFAPSLRWQLPAGPAGLRDAPGETTPVRIVHGAAAVARLQSGWQRLEADIRCSPMQHYIWAQACVETFGGTLAVVIAGPDDDPVALAPFAARNGFLARLESPGVSELGEPSDCLCRDPAALPPVAAALLACGSPVALERVPVDSPFLAALQAESSGRALVRRRPAESCPYVALDESWRAPELKLNAGRRSDLRRALRRASDRGPVTYDVLSPAPAQLPALLDEALAVEAAGWKGAAGTALVLDAARGAFYRRYAAAACSKGVLRLAFMRIAGRPVAIQIALECANRYWLLKIGHDERFAQCSPGTLLLVHTLQYAAARGLETYEFLGREEAWTKVWARASRACASWRAYPYQRDGLAALTVDAARAAWSRVRTRPALAVRGS